MAARDSADSEGPCGAAALGEKVPRRPPRPHNLFAAIDLGTNNCRLLVARPQRQGFEVIDAFSRIVRLGEGLDRDGALSEAAMTRAIEALKICAAKVERRNAIALRAVATEACRRASNCSPFLARVRAETGIRLEILSPREEARLGIVGCAPLLSAEAPRGLIFDIGGGSTEVTWIDVYGAPGRPARPLLKAWWSIPHGVVTLSERYAGRAGCYQEMVETIEAELAPFEARQRICEEIAAGRVQMIGTSGTVTTLSGMEQKLPRYDRSRVDGAYLTRETALALCGEVARMDEAARVGHPCIGEARSDLVVAGCAILEAICRLWPAERIRVADRGLREGLVLAMMVRRPPARYRRAPRDPAA